MLQSQNLKVISYLDKDVQSFYLGQHFFGCRGKLLKKKKASNLGHLHSIIHISHHRIPLDVTIIFLGMMITYYRRVAEKVGKFVDLQLVEMQRNNKPPFFGKSPELFCSLCLFAISVKLKILSFGKLSTSVSTSHQLIE